MFLGADVSGATQSVFIQPSFARASPRFGFDLDAYPEQRVAATSNEETMKYGFWRVIAIACFVFALASVSARADDNYYTFRSAVPQPGNTCIDAPNGQFQPAMHLQLWQCSNTPGQSFGYESQNTLTAGGLCLDGISSNSGQPPSAGDPVGLNECDGSDHQVWELQ